MTDGKDTDVFTRPGTMDAFAFEEMAGDVYRVVDYVRPGDVVMDVGANIGAFARHVMSHVPGVRVVCIEPVPSNCEVLRKNVGDRASVEASALSAETGALTLYDFGEAASMCHSMYDVGAKDARSIQVPTETLDGLMRKYGFDRVRFLKMDCQGAEYEIIPSTPHRVLARIDCIAMEIHASIWGPGGRIGNIPRSRSKMRRLYRHLAKTHVPAHGRIYRGEVELWLNRNEIDDAMRRKLLRKYWIARLYRPVLYPFLREGKRLAERLLSGLRKRGAA